MQESDQSFARHAKYTAYFQDLANELTDYQLQHKNSSSITRFHITLRGIALLLTSSSQWRGIPMHCFGREKSRATKAGSLEKDNWFRFQLVEIKLLFWKFVLRILGTCSLGSGTSCCSLHLRALPPLPLHRVFEIAVLTTWSQPTAQTSGNQKISSAGCA